MRISIGPLSLLVGAAVAVEVVFVTELDIYSSLAPCAQYAVSYNVQSLTYSKCPEDASALQACVCTKNNNLASIASDLAKSVSYSCGSTATDDQASASTVLNAYCNQDKPVTFPTATSPVNAYITEVAEIGALAKCAQSALGYGVASLTWTQCPSDAPALASCACSKNGVSALATRLISSSAKYSCSSHTADVSSALDFFAAFCAMGNGTSSFPKPTNPPGDMTYFITDLPNYSSLAPCAKSAVSYAVQYQTQDLCPDGPQALASCACLKDGMTKEILSSISSGVRYSCESTATDDISSAVNLYNYYCSAAQSLVVASGVTASVEQIYPAGTPISGSRSGSGAKPTSTNGSTSDSSAGANKTSKGPGTGVIVGVVVGVIVVLALIGVVVFFVMKNARKKREQQLASDQVPMTGRPSTSPGNTEFYNGKQELPAESISGPLPPPSPSPSTLKVNHPPRVDTVSPVSAHGGAFSPPAYHAELNGQSPPVPPMPYGAELPGQGSPYYSPRPQGAELQGQVPAHPPNANTAELYGQGAAFQHPPRPELQGQGAAYPPPARPELQGQGAPYPGPFRQELPGQYSNYPTPPQQSAQPYSPYSPAATVSPASTYVQPSPAGHAAGMSWQSGPVPMVHEMDGGAYPAPGQAR
ncbi:hypothetical protein QBC47DRAFT_360566 [Echria macrotheca]|uniref:Uncharacterized protein n=1 Tax=Echria macrotheca TaxID=438768 RepID=A0AAJ0BCA8_9PEZI|nr:hypothetical protein QBC47DRAFT_360566 [Echria macrotheca]